MNKKRVLALAIGMVFIISGCGNSNETTKNTNSTNQSVAEGSVTTEINNKSTSKKLKMLSGSGDSYNTENGRYYISGDEENGTIRFIDYNAGKEVYLCNKLNCEHNNKDCTAVLPNEDMESYLFGDGTYLYILSTPYDSSGTMSVSEGGVEEGDAGLIAGGGSEEPPAIYRMNPDGTGREKVFEFESGIVAEQNVAGDGEYLYIVIKKVKSKTEGNTTYTSGYDRKIVKLNLEKGTSEEVLELNNEQTLLGCSGRNLIISENDYGRELSPEEKFDDNQYKALYGDSTYIISGINVDSKEVTELKSIQNSSDKLHGELIHRDKLYTTYEGRKQIEITNLETGETKKLKVNDSYQIEHILSIENEPDVIVAMLYSEIVNDENGWSNYLINTETGEVTKSTLQTRYKNPIKIVAQSEEDLYVQNDYKNDTEYVAWADVNQEYISEVEYSVISKKDYLSNKGNYQKVELLNGGKLEE